MSVENHSGSVYHFHKKAEDSISFQTIVIQYLPSRFWIFAIAETIVIKILFFSSLRSSHSSLSLSLEFNKFHGITIFKNLEKLLLQTKPVQNVQY